MDPFIVAVTLFIFAPAVLMAVVSIVSLFGDRE